jgi:hypothetical protein
MTVEMRPDVTYENRYFPRTVRGIPITYTTDPKTLKTVRPPHIVALKEAYDLVDPDGETVEHQVLWAYRVMSVSAMSDFDTSPNYARINNLASRKPRQLLRWHVYRVLRHVARSLR